MSESSGEKHFDPTPSRLAKARRDGNLPRAQEFPANLAFAAAVAAVFAVVPAFGACARDAIASAALGHPSWTAVAGIVLCALVPFAASASCGAAANVIQNGGFVFVTPSIKPERLQPVEGMKRMFSRDAVTHGVRAALAFAIACGVAAPAVTALCAIAGVNPLLVAAAAWEHARTIAFSIAGLGVLLGALEYGVARKGWLKKLKMSFDEIKRDMKEQEGDPWTRARRKAMHRSLLKGSLAQVKEASFVVVNPTHVAVALRYAPPEVPVPLVLVAAADEMALRVKALAREHNVAIIENVPLARALLRDAQPGQPIPHAHYVAVAEVVAALLRTTR